MLLVLPFSAADVHLVMPLAKLMVALGPYGDHELLLSCSADQEETRDKVQQVLEPHFSKVHTLTALNQRTGWPHGCNTLFFETAVHIYRNLEASAGWYFYEPDNTPLRGLWLDTLAREYAHGQRPCMGVVYPTWMQRINKDGTRVRFQDGHHLVGTSVYPKDYPKHCEALFRTLPLADLAFDVYLQWYSVPLSHHTPLIQHQWGTHRYRKDKATGLIQGENINPEEPRTPDPLNSHAVVHHGCKDSSLLNFVKASLKESAKDLVAA